jgi:hypothetical protein
MERRQLQEKEKMRKEAAAKIRETQVAMAQLAGGWRCPGRCGSTALCWKQLR